ncbi:MAG: hypothetical protein KME26_13015 [Oscillatoria princeps RMCB-10]|jgi:hypothetical protein|nr:hypothetical protein [Oscillatoria princeps RMCB-10]
MENLQSIVAAATFVGVIFLVMTEWIHLTIAAGLLTLVGAPATFIVGDAVNISFADYLLKLSLGVVVAIVTILVMLPWLLPKICGATARCRFVCDATFSALGERGMESLPTERARESGAHVCRAMAMQNLCLKTA